MSMNHGMSACAYARAFLKEGESRTCMQLGNGGRYVATCKMDSTTSGWDGR